MRFYGQRNKKKYVDRYNKFIVQLFELNEDLLNDVDNEYKECRELPCRNITILSDDNIEIVLPKGYKTVNNINKKASNSDVTYVCDKDGKVVCGISYKSNGTLNYAYPKRFIVPYEEYILQKASIITEEYFGSSREDYLKLALLKMMDGNYNYFTKYDNTRFKLMLLHPRMICKLMINTLERNDINVSFSTAGIIEMYVNYIKDKVNSVNKNDNKKYVKSIE